MAAPGLQMIRDTIYALKQEYGLRVLLININTTRDLGTGVRSSSYVTKAIPKAILLPQSMAHAFTKMFNFSKAGLLESDERLLLIDKKDLRGFNTKMTSVVGYDGSGLNYINLSSIDWDNIEQYNKDNNKNIRRAEVKKIEDSLYAVAITVQGINAINLI